MPEHVILHVGPHKTGSSGLQQLFRSLRPRLLDLGILYPETGCIGAAHHGIADLIRGRAPDSLARDLTDETAGARMVLISSEQLVVASTAGLRRLAALFPGAEVRVILSLRRLCEVWPSHWQELVKHGQFLSFPDYLAQAAMGWPESGWTALNQPDQLGKLAEAFGREALTILGYDALAERDIDIGRHVLSEVLGLSDLAEGVVTPRINRRMHDWKVELLRLLHRAMAERGERPGSRIGLALDRWLDGPGAAWLDDFRGLVAAAPILDLDSRGPLVSALQGAVVERYADRFHGDASAVAEAYLSPRIAGVPVFDLPLGAAAKIVGRIETLGRELEAVSAVVGQAASEPNDPRAGPAPVD